jgi:hypothetical protein
MSFETLGLWLFEPADGSCDRCGERQGLYSYAVEPPHENCHCTVTSGEVKAELIATREDLVDQYELVEEVTWMPRGGELAVEQNWSTGTETTVSGEGSVEEGGIGATIGGSQTDSATSGGSKTVTFRYDTDVGGASQLVVALYQVKVFQTVQTYRAHWSEGMGADFEFEVIAATREERAFSGYRQVAF